MGDVQMAIMMVMMMMVHIKHIIFPVIKQEKVYQTNFAILKFILGSEAWGIETKEMFYSLLSLKMISFVFLFYPPSLAAKYDFTYISKLVYLFDKLNPANYVYASVI